MSMFMAKGVNIVVAQGETDSPPVIMNETFRDADVIGIIAPDTLPEVASFQVSVDFDPNYAANNQTLGQAIAAAHWDAVDAAADLPAAGAYKSIWTRYLVGTAIRIHLNGATSAERVFRTVKRSLVF